MKYRYFPDYLENNEIKIFFIISAHLFL